MPYAPKRPCTSPGCSALTSNGRCDKHPHDNKQSRHYDKQRGTSAQRGYGHKWRKIRAQYLAAHPLCKHCQAKGIAKPATDLDHIIPHRGNQELFDDPNNLQGLCKSCHSKKTAKGQ